MKLNLDPRKTFSIYLKLTSAAVEVARKLLSTKCALMAEAASTCSKLPRVILLSKLARIIARDLLLPKAIWITVKDFLNKIPPFKLGTVHKLCNY